MQLIDKRNNFIDIIEIDEVVGHNLELVSQRLSNGLSFVAVRLAQIFKACLHRDESHQETLWIVST